MEYMYKEVINSNDYMFKECHIDLSGKQIQSLVNDFQESGYHSVDWNADTHPSGICFVKMIAGDYVNTQKLMLVK